jgi:hypothetical protein
MSHRSKGYEWQTELFELVEMSSVATTVPYAVSHDVSPEEFQTAIEPPEPSSQTSQELSKTRTYKYKSLSNHYIRLIQITSLGLS